jgi:hypothetical protein
VERTEAHMDSCAQEAPCNGNNEPLFPVPISVAHPSGMSHGGNCWSDRGTATVDGAQISVLHPGITDQKGLGP